MIIGVDEAGRGALAGPVVAGAVFKTEQLENQKIIKLTDSKQLTESERETAFEWITKHCVFGIGMVEADEIDAIGIKKANQQAMNMAVEQVVQKCGDIPEKVLVDGRDRFVFPYPSKDIIRGDEKELCIAAGSVIAKVTRDRIMETYDKRYPEYDFGRNKGYGSEKHRALVEKGMYSPLHRKSYDPLRTILTQGKLF